MNTRISRHASEKEIEEIFVRLQPIFAKVGVEEMEMYSDLEEDLSVNMATDFPQLIKDINREFSINLDVKATMSEVTVVAELVDLIIEEITLG